MQKQELRDIPKLGFGLMRLPQKDDVIDTVQLNQMVDTYLQNGFTYFDTAYVYHGGKSETAFKAAVVDRYPRESFTIADKLPGWVIHSKEDVQRIFDEQLERTGAGYFDFYLLHNSDANNLKVYDEFGCWEFVQEMKKKGLIRHCGFSFHDSPELLDKILSDHPEVEFVQLQINYFDWENEAVRSRKCYETARKHGKFVVIMEPVKGGALASLTPDLENKMKAVSPERSIASWALRFCATLDGVMVVLSGMSAEVQMADNLETVKHLQPLTSQEKDCLDEVIKILHAAPTVGCTGCHYCVDGCPQKIKIPEVIHAYNDVLTYGDHEPSHGFYRMMTSEGHTADTCIHCGQCEGVCPQHLPVTEILEKASAIFDR